MFSFCIFFPPMFPLFPKFSTLLQGCEKSGKLPTEKKLAFNKNCWSHKRFYVKAYFFKKKQAISPSQIPDAFEIKLGCPVRNFWTEMWMPITKRGLIRSLEIIYLAWMVQKWLAPALGSGISHERLG